MAPKISVCMPTYNYARYLREAIESVLRQDYADFEFVIVDDCSADGSAQIIREYAGKDDRITATLNRRNVGMVGNWNLCLSRARGEYIKFLFGDDTLASPSALGKMVSVLESDRTVSLVASSRILIDQTSKPLCIIGTYRGPAKCEGSDAIRDCIIEQKNRIGEPSAVMFRKVHAARGFDARFRQIVDLEMWFHILEQGRFAYLAEPLVSFRKHPEQQTEQNAGNPELIEEPFTLLDRYARKPYLHLSRVQKEYMHYLPVYSIWKLYKRHGKISRQEAIEQIRNRYGLTRFAGGYSFFKLYKLYRSLRYQP